MIIGAEQRYTIVIRFPWGERREACVSGLIRETDGTVRWMGTEALGVEPYLDNIVREEEQWLHGWVPPGDI